MMNSKQIRRVGIIGGSRTPFCRSFGAYQELTNSDLMTTALQGLTDKFNLHDARIGEVVGGAVATHANDWNLARECVIGTTLSPATPGITMMQACGTSLQAAMGIAAKIAIGQIESGIAAGSDTVSNPAIEHSKKMSARLVQMSRSKGVFNKWRAFKGFKMGELAPVPPNAGEVRTGLNMGQHCELMAKHWNISRDAQDELACLSHKNGAKAYEEGFLFDLLTPCAGIHRDDNLRPDTSVEKLAELRPAFDRSDAGTLTAGNSTPLTDGASCVLLASEDWAAQRDLPVLAWLDDFETAAVDFVSGEGLLMAPTAAVANLLKRTGQKLQDFDYYEIHEAFAAQVLCTLKAWQDETYCREKLGGDAALGVIDRDLLNIKGSSLAYGHPFAATGGRILSSFAKMLSGQSGKKGLMTLCTAGGMGVAATLEAA